MASLERTEGLGMTREELIAALEAATGPSRELDAEIGTIIGAEPRPTELLWNYSGRRGVPYWKKEHIHYTSSIDAALTSVPEGWAIAEITYTDKWSVRLRCPVNPSLGWTRREIHKDLPPAICTAALKARADD